MSGASASADLQSVLRGAFAQEVAERLPRLVDGSDLDAVRRDAHTLVSSAAVIGEPDIAQAAREVELGGPTDALVALLQGWTP